MVHPSIGCLGTLVKTQPRFVRLANGKLARISTKKITSPFAIGRAVSIVESPENAFTRDTKKIVPSVTAESTSSSEPIDVATLIGSGSTTSDETPLFKTDSDPAVVKDEPMDVEEKPEQKEHEKLAPLERVLVEPPATDVSSKEQPQKPQQPAPPPASPPQPSVGAVLKSLVASGRQVGDLGRILEQPLFSHDRPPPPIRDSCKVCRVVVPGLKK
ncbi:hypothetical protein COOONC_05718 [Cooperia oncophora]